MTLWPIFDRERDDRWSGGARIVLLGDACHPMRPLHGGGRRHGGRGRGHPRSLPGENRGDPAEAFRCYEATRIPRVAKVQDISIANTWMRGPTDTEWFFCYDACMAPLAM